MTYPTAAEFCDIRNFIKRYEFEYNGFQKAYKARAQDSDRYDYEFRLATPDRIWEIRSLLNGAHETPMLLGKVISIGHESEFPYKLYCILKKFNRLHALIEKEFVDF